MQDEAARAACVDGRDGKHIAPCGKQFRNVELFGARDLRSGERAIGDILAVQKNGAVIVDDVTDEGLLDFLFRDIEFRSQITLLIDAIFQRLRIDEPQCLWTGTKTEGGTT